MRIKLMVLMLTGIWSVGWSAPVDAEQRRRAPLPESVEKREVTIFSDGTRMVGDLYLPRSRNPNSRLPAVIFCNGTGGTRKGTASRLGPIFADHGFAFLAFDYRGWGDSESQLMAVKPQSRPDENGEMTIRVRALRWQMNYADQTVDIRAAISFLAGELAVDPERIGIMGSSYGGGLVTWVAGNDPRVKCVVAQVPGLGGGRGPAAEQRMYRLHTRQARGETEPVPLETGRMQGQMARYEHMRVNPAKSIGYSAVEAAGKITAPILFVVAENEELSNNETVERVYESILKRGVPAKYHVIPGITHYGIYREGFEEATNVELAWFERHLKEEEATSSDRAAKTKNAPEPETQRGANAARRQDPETTFRALDTDQDGLLSRSEFNKLRETVPVFRENPIALDRFFDRLDEDGDGRISLDEFRKIGSQRRQRPVNRPDSQPEQRQRPKPEAPPERSSPKPNSPTIPSVSEDQALSHFERKIRPVLVKSCYECHSAEAQEVKGGLALDSREGIRRGGDSGPAVVPGDVQSSLLTTALRHQDGYEMPPQEKLSDEQITDFVRWIETGAIDPRDGESARSSTALDLEQGREFWSFQRPVKPPLPAVQDDNWPLTDIDRFILAAQEEQQVRAVGDADPRILIRRLHFDLIGLPPEPADVRAFVSSWQHDPERAIEETVDRLLESPRFGERWGRHWLDVARYAESSGNETSFAYPQAWRYRDYVIDSLNADVPFDQFIREQLAGDLLPAENDQQRAEQLIATGFLALGPKSHIERDKLQFEMDLVDEQIDAVTQAFLGLTVACARCHDHKFDPVPQADYYALAGIFRSTETLYGTIPLVQNRNPSDLLMLPTGSGIPAGIPAITPRERQLLERRITLAREQRTTLLKERKTATSEFLRAGIQLNTFEGRLKTYEPDGTPKLLAMGVRDRETPQDSPMYIRGEVERPGKTVPRGFVQVLCGDSPATIGQGSGRLELAEWIASADHPLTARVIVNRVWQHVFGRGLVPTPDNFGVSGQPPSHPELLDHLVVTFVEDGWSMKRLIRHLVLSRVYRLDFVHDEANAKIDPENVWLWRMSPRRLDAESIRDAMLATAGKLDLQPPIGSIIAEEGEGYTGALERGSKLSDDNFNCRSVYLPVIRGKSFESLVVFDGVDGSAITGQRPMTIVPSQSLYLLNSPFVMGLAQAAAQRLMTERSNAEARIDLAYQRWFGRSASETERDATIAFLERYRESAREGDSSIRHPEFSAWTVFCQSLWASGEFLLRR